MENLNKTTLLDGNAILHSGRPEDVVDIVKSFDRNGWIGSTAELGTNNTQLATTAFVNAEILAETVPIAHAGATGTAHGQVTTLVNGFMTAADKTKLDGIATGAQVNPTFTATATDIKMNGTQSVGALATIARADHVHPVDTSRQPLGNELTALQALADTAGFLKKTGDGIYTIDTSTYNNYSHPTGDGNLHVPVTSTTNSGKVLTAGATAGTFTWEVPASTMTFTATPTDIKMNGTQAVGVLTTAPRADHVHPSDTTRAPIASPTFTGVATAPTFQSGSYQIVYNASETSLDFMYTG